MLLLLLVLQRTCLCFVQRSSFAYGRVNWELQALKFDPADQVRVSIDRPFGIELEEAEEGQASGVFVGKINPDGNGAKDPALVPGLFLMSVGGVDVKNMKFDGVLDTIGSMPEVS